MTSTSRHNEFTGPCRCGQGTFKVDFCEVDHGYPVANPEWYEGGVDCPVCGPDFTVEKRGQGFYLVPRAEIARKDVMAREAYQALRAVRQDPQFAPVIDRFVALVDDLPSAAATYRYLSPLGLTDGTLPTFRKHWRGAAKLAEGLSARDLRAVFGVMLADASQLEVLLQQIEARLAEARTPVEPAGAAIYTV